MITKELKGDSYLNPNLPKQDCATPHSFFISISENFEDMKELIKHILETIDEGFIIIDRDFKIMCANRSYSNMVKIPIENIIGKHCYEISHHFPKPCYEYASSHPCTVKHVFETGKHKKAIHTHYDQKGNPVYVETKAYPLSKDHSGKVTSAIEIVIDITEKKKLEDQLRQAHKMEAVGTLAGGVAHDFNNILQAIIGFGVMAKKKIKDDEETIGFIEEILASAKRAAELTHGLLAFSRQQVIIPQTQDLNRIITNMKKMLRRLIEEDIELKIDLFSSDIMVKVDAGQIEQVVMNLVANARDAMPEGGHLLIETAVVTIDRCYAEAHLFESVGNYAVLTVSDTGKGMDIKTRENIFEPFFTTKEVGKGTGLGLAMAYGIIKQHDGNINVYSELGMGTTFRIYLPLTKKLDYKETNEPAKSMPLGGGETILIAEDDQQVREIIKMHLQEYGYKTIEAENGMEAVEKFKKNPDKISLLLLDVIMPFKNGIDAYEDIKLIRPDMRVLYMSGYTDSIIRTKGVLHESFDFLSKPVDPAGLLLKIRNSLDRLP
ncbi:MAG: response regulator [Nitrospirae bacterium]|nr:response regulator [Nitrospirota bacterium]